MDVFKGITSFDPERAVPFQAWLNKVADNRLARVFRDRSRKKRGGGVWRVDGNEGSVNRLINDLDDSQAITASRNFAKNEAKQAVEL